MVVGLIISVIAIYAESPALAMLCIFPYFLGAIVGGTAHSPSEAGFILGLVLEWGVIGYVLARIVGIFVENKPGGEIRRQKEKP